MGRYKTLREAAWRAALVVSGPGLAILLALGGATAWAAGNATATISPKDALSFREMIDEARHAEVDGRDQEHDHWVRQALQEAPDEPAVHWLAGEVQVGGRWTKIGEAASTLTGDKNYQDYLRIRPQYAASLRDQLRLGQWCASHGLKDQARAHFSRVVDLDPNNTTARKRLGYKQWGGQWRTAEEIEQAQVRSKQSRNDLAQWRPKLQKLRAPLASRDTKQREAAREQLAEISDPAAIPAMEIVLGTSNATTTVAAVDTIAKIRGQEASLSLARMAAFSPWMEPRRRATEELKSRPLVDFVPTMLAAMVAPIDYREEVYNGSFAPMGPGAAAAQTAASFVAGDRLLHRQIFSRETSAGRVERAFDTPFAFQGDPAIVQMLARRAVESNGLTPWQQLRLDAENSRLAERNRPIATVLADISGEQLGNSPRAWWDWWDRQNDTYRESRVAQQSVAPKYSYGSLPGSLSLVVGECFVAGTTIWTIDGPKPIERVQVGDLVLSQNVDSGELTYKPVLKAAERPPTALVTVTIGGETIRCTGGHPFWVPGSGWVQARRLDPPARLHALTGAVHALKVEPATKDKTYNLEVADFHSYFVGSEKILAHDVTALAPTTTKVPGLKSR